MFRTLGKHNQEAGSNFFRKSAFSTNSVVQFAQCSTGNPPTRSGIGDQKSKLSPATAESTVELDDGDGFALLSVYEIEFRGIKAGVRG
jgi:hypothetical protein